MEACITPTLVKLVEDEPPRIHPTETRAACGLEGLFCLWVGRLSLPVERVNSGPAFGRRLSFRNHILIGLSPGCLWVGRLILPLGWKSFFAC